jgi:hypothetical protein
MSCNGGGDCHEFYSQAAADAVRADCVSLHQTISSSPCPTSLPDCCMKAKGSYGNPEGVCLARGELQAGDCESAGGTVCKR